MSLVERVSTAWGGDVPDWVRLMAEHCTDSSQKRVSQEMGYSTTVISLVLSNKYPGDITAVETAFKGAFQSVTVNCPVLGELEAQRCLENQRRKYAATNATRVRLFKACNSGTCQYSRRNNERG